MPEVRKPRALYVLSERAFESLYGPEERADVDELVEVYAPPLGRDEVRENLSVLEDAEVILSGWSGPRLDEEFLAAAPNLRAFFYGAGTLKNTVTDAFWETDIIITSSWAANAIPVAEYCLSQILFCLKHGWQHALCAERESTWRRLHEVPGAYGSNVGLISLGMIGMKTLELLRPFDVNVLVYSTSTTEEEAEEMGVELCSLDDIFRRSDVISLMTPLLPQTRGMITGRHFELMKDGAAFINTARGAVVRQEEMVEVLGRRPELLAVLDVTHPEPPPEDSPLWDLPNVVLTPHIAGALGQERHRLGRYAVEELRRYLHGEPLKYRVTQEMFRRMA
ncbi:MAG: hydroxyacid dehydrogenase [Candidatus Brocadiia bacterium]